jgi:multidrug efflux system outer membrane protein
LPGLASKAISGIYLIVKTISPVVACLFLACGSAPKVAIPVLNLDPPANWSAPFNDTESTATPVLWWMAFGDTVLASYVFEALQQNHDLQIAATRVEAAGAQARIAGAALLPQVNANLDGSRRRQNFIGLPIPGAGGDVLSSTTSTYGASLSSSWELDLWGRLRAGKSAALADVQASLADMEAARLSLIAQTSRAFFAALESTGQVRLSKSTVENLRLASEQIRERYTRGLRPSLDLRLALSNEATAAAVLQQRLRARDAALRRLELLLGRYPSATIRTGELLPSVPPAVPAGLPAELISRRPDLIAAERRLAAAGARVTEARRALYPRLSLTASGGRSSSELKDLLHGDFAVWNLVSNLTQPLFHGGRIRAGIDLAGATSRQTLIRFVQSVLRAFGEVEAALAAEHYLARQELSLHSAAAEARAGHTLASERYAQGLVDMTTLLEAQRRAFDADSQLLMVRRQRIDARIDLHLALGGDFDSKADPERESTE